MGIKVTYLGGLGNQLWQYAVARVLAEQSSTQLMAPAIHGFPRTRERVGSISWSSLLPLETITGHVLPEKKDSKLNLHLKGYFQRFEYLDVGKGMEQVKQWCTPIDQGVEPPGEEELVISIRRGSNGWPTSLCPTVDYYHEVIRELGSGRAKITTDSPNDPWFDALVDNRNIKIWRGSPLQQFEYIRLAKRVVMAPSTFSFWASFVGNANHIFLPNCAEFSNTVDGANWIPANDKRFVRL